MEQAFTDILEKPLAILVDDDTSVCEAMGNLLNSVGIETKIFNSAQALLETSLPDCPSCLVLDVRMPGISGLDLQNHLTRSGVSTPVLFLTAHGDIEMSVQAMKAGAHDFLTKPVRDQTFLDAVSKAIGRDRERRAKEIDLDVERQKASSAWDSNANMFEALTEREKTILRLVTEGQLNKQIAHALGLSEVTVKLHRRNALKKMQVTSLSQLFTVWQGLPAELKDSISPLVNPSP